MANLFLFVGEQQVSPPTLLEYAWDFDKGDFVLDKGRFVLVEGQEAARIQVRKALMTERFRYLAYSRNYGQEFEQLMGSGLDEAGARSELQRYALEALSTLGYVTGVLVVEFSLVDGKLDAVLSVQTLYGEVVADV